MAVSVQLAILDIRAKVFNFSHQSFLSIKTLNAGSLIQCENSNYFDQITLLIRYQKLFAHSFRGRIIVGRMGPVYCGVLLLYSERV